MSVCFTSCHLYYYHIQGEAHLLGSDIAGELHTASFRGVTCILSGSSPEVDSLLLCHPANLHQHILYSLGSRLHVATKATHRPNRNPHVHAARTHV